MKQTLLIIITTFLLTSCSEEKWWGDRKISQIASENGNLESFEYDEQGRLTHYKNTAMTTTESGTDTTLVYYDLEISHQDTVVIMKGIMPYYDLNSEERSKYLYAETTYKLTSGGLAISASTNYIDSSFVDNTYNLSTKIKYNKGRLSEINGKDIYFDDSKNIDYKRSGKGMMIVSTFRNYATTINKSLLPQEIEDYVDIHLPAFYAGILGKPSRCLLSRDVYGGQIVEDYSYVLDSEGYVTEYTIQRSSNVRVFGGNPAKRNKVYTITYKD